jgi:PhnB protein
MMKLNPHLSFNGQCEAAFKFYEQCLGGHTQTIMRWGESPMAEHVSSALHDKIIHATMAVGDTLLMGSDSPPERYEKPQGFTVTIQVQEVVEAERIFQALAENGQVTMPIQQTFWSVRFGMLVDQFGIPWMVNCQQAA